MLYDYSPSGNELASFVDAYIDCAAWVAERTADDLSDDDTDTLTDEATAFLYLDETDGSHAVRLIQAAIFRASRMHGAYSWAQAGHDFYLTREGHGAGYWDRGLGIVGDALTALAKPYGSSDYMPERREPISSNGFSVDDQTSDVLSWLSVNVPSVADAFAVEFPEYATLAWSGSWADTDASGVDVDYMSHVRDWLDTHAPMIVWEDGEPFAII